ncbi:hypothetical protein B835_300 [Enterococcus mundtii 3F]|nr:hypothetical protein [Enterococcus mundtii 3F]
MDFHGFLTTTCYVRLRKSSTDKSIGTKTMNKKEPQLFE